MPIRLDYLHDLGDPNVMNKAASANLFESAAGAPRTVFLCHSHLDARHVRGFVRMLATTGWIGYVDWQDATLPPTPSMATAAKIKSKIRDLGYFFFLATPNSMQSRWCPWEIGYADGVKPHDRIVVVPTVHGTITHGSEYLNLYRKVEYTTTGELRIWNPGQTEDGLPLTRM